MSSIQFTGHYMRVLVIRIIAGYITDPDINFVRVMWIGYLVMWYYMMYNYYAYYICILYKKRLSEEFKQIAPKLLSRSYSFDLNKPVLF